MYAVFTEVDVPGGASQDQARQTLNDTAIPMARSQGASMGFWLSPQGGRGIGVIVFPDESAAKAMASMLRVGEAPRGAPEGVKFRTVEVREVVASF